jgi:hypothetical protein
MTKAAVSWEFESEDRDKYIFMQVSLRFADHIETNIFGLKNNKSPEGNKPSPV